MESQLCASAFTLIPITYSIQTIQKKSYVAISKRHVTIYGRYVIQPKEYEKKHVDIKYPSNPNQ